MPINTPSNGSDFPHKYHKVANGEPIRQVLDKPQEDKIVDNQAQRQETLIASKKIKKMEGLPENLKANQNTNELYKILQIACSDPRYFFVDNGRLIFDKQSAEHNHKIYKELVDDVVIVPSTLPESFIQQFGIDHIDDNAQNIKNIFKWAKPLHYVDETKGKYTNRVLFYQGKIIIFRTIKTMLSYDDPNTVGEKRKYDTNKYFNTYWSLYDAIRSQEYIMENQDQSANEFKEIQEKIIELIVEIKIDIKNGEILRKLDNIKEEIKNAKSHHIVAAQIHNMTNIIWRHSEREKRYLIWAKNKFSKRIAEIKQYVAMIDIQTNEMNNIRHELEYLLEMLDMGMNINVAFDGSKNEQILRVFQRFFEAVKKLDYIPDPFAKFFHQIFTSLGKSLDDIKKVPVEEFVSKALMLFALQRIGKNIMNIEHAIKLGKKTYQDINIKEELDSIKRIAEYPQIQEKYDAVLFTIQEEIDDLELLMKQPENQEDKIQKSWDLLKEISTTILF